MDLRTISLMSPQHAISTIVAQFDPLTSTPLEEHLASMVERLLDTLTEHSKVIALVEDSDITSDQVADLLAAVIDSPQTTIKLLAQLADHSIDSPSVLAEKLQRADAFYDIAQEAGDIFDRLSTLANSTL